jgi:RHS repeat-associated protein
VELQEGSKTELYQIMMARYYSSSLGRFMAVDPGDDTGLENPQSWNKYAYVRNNPVGANDPNGRAATAVAGGAGFIIGGLVGMGVEAYSQWRSGQGYNAQDIAAAGWGGAVTGGLAGLTAGGSLLGSTLLHTAATGAGSSIVGGAVQRGLDSDAATAPLNPGAMVTDGLAGGGGAVCGEVAADGVQSVLGPIVESGALPGASTGASFGNAAAAQAPAAAGEVVSCTIDAVTRGNIEGAITPRDETPQGTNR